MHKEWSWEKRWAWGCSAWLIVGAYLINTKLPGMASLLGWLFLGMLGLLILYFEGKVLEERIQNEILDELREIRNELRNVSHSLEVLHFPRQ